MIKYLKLRYFSDANANLHDRKASYQILANQEIYRTNQPANLYVKKSQLSKKQLANQLLN